MKYGELIKLLQDKLGFSYEGAQGYLASAFYVIATDEQIKRVEESIRK